MSATPNLTAPNIHLNFIGAQHIKLSWQAVKSATTYQIFRSTIQGGPYTLMETTNGTTYTWTDTTITNAATYYYVVVASDGVIETPNSNEVSAVVLPAPLNLATNASSSWVHLTWEDVSGALKYNIYRKSGTGAFVLLTTVDNPEYYDYFVSDGITYGYKVVAVDPHYQHEGLFSVEVNSTPRVSPPGNVTAHPSGGQVSLNWDMVSGASGYTVWIGMSSGNYSESKTITQFNHSYVWAGLTNGVTYYFAITSTDAAGNSEYSQEVSATPTILSTPTNLAAVVHSGSIDLSWDSVSGATGYHIYRKVSGGTYSFIASSVDPNYTDSSVTNGTEYYYHVTAISSNSGESLPSNEVSATPRVTPPVNVNAVPGNGSVTLTWDTVAGATSYKVRLGTSSGVYTFTKTTRSTTYHWSGLSNGVVYYFVVTSVDVLGESGYSQEVSATPTTLPAPTNLTAETGMISRTIDLEWDGVGGAYQYKIYRKYGAGSYSYIGYSNTTSYHDGGALSNGVEYTYQVTAVSNTLGESAPSNEASATPHITPPLNFSAVSPLKGYISLSWDAVAGASSYKIRMGTSSGIYTTTKAVNSFQTGYDWDGLSDGTTYYFVITAVDSYGESVYSPEISVTTDSPPDAPMNLVAVAGDSRVILSWNAVTGLDYSVYRKTAGGNYSFRGNSSSSTYSDTNVTNGITYYYYITTSTFTGGVSQPSNEVSATPHKIPINVSAAPGNQQVVITWDNVPSAISYKIYIGTSSGPYSGVQNSSTNSYTWANLTNGTTYYFVVTSIDSAGESNYSEEVSATPVFGTVQNLVATPGNAEVLLNWDVVSGASYYAVKRSITPGGPHTQIDLAFTNSYIDTSAVNDSTYYYVVTPISGSSEGGTSNEASAMPYAPLAAPLNVTAVGGYQQVTVNWDVVSGASRYRIYRKIGTGAYNYWTTISLTTFTDYVNNGTTYYYKISAVDSNQNEGMVSAEVSATPRIPPPTNIIANPGHGQVTITWNSVTNATGYKIRIGTASGIYSDVKIIPYGYITSYTWTGLTNGTTYYFVVTSTDSTNESIYSPEVSAMPDTVLSAAPTNLIATAGNAQVSLTWSVVTGATRYVVKRATTTGGSYSVIEDQVAATNYQDSTVTNGVTYYYVVSAGNSAGTSGNSNEASATPMPPAPTAPDAPTFSNLTSTSVDVTAPALPENADSLILQVKVAGADDSTYTTVQNGLDGEETITAGWLESGVTYTFRYVAVGLGGETPGAIANVVIPSRDISWNPANPISCAGIYYPTGTTAIIAAGMQGRFSAYLATAWDVRTVTVDGVSTTALYSEPCTYTWSADGGDAQDGINTGQSFVWIAPITPGTYTITLDVADQNDGNKGNGESGTRHRNGLSFSMTVTVE